MLDKKTREDVADFLVFSVLCASLAWGIMLLGVTLFNDESPSQEPAVLIVKCRGKVVTVCLQNGHKPSECNRLGLESCGPLPVR